MKKKLVRIVAGLLAGVLALVPLTAFAKTGVNPKVTKSDGTLKDNFFEVPASYNVEGDEATGYYFYDSNGDKIDAYWWKTVADPGSWKEVSKTEYDLADESLRKFVDNGFTSWRIVDVDTYLSVTDPELKQESFTDWRSATHDEYLMTSNPDLKDSYYGPWVSATKDEYDSLSEVNRRYTYSPYRPATYEEWKNASDKSITFPGDFKEVTRDEYFAHIEKYEDDINQRTYEGKDKLYYYEDFYTPGTFEGYPFEGVVWSSEGTDHNIAYCVIANTLESTCHIPGFVLVHTITDNSSLIEGMQWNGQSNGIRYMNEFTTAQSKAESWMNIINQNNILYTTITSGADVPKFKHPVGLNNSTIIKPDESFKIYVYEGTETLELHEFYGIVIAPNAKVNVDGKWCGSIIADYVTNIGESTAWEYETGKGSPNTKYYIREPELEVRDIIYEKRTSEYFVRDYKYEVRDRDYKYYVTSEKTMYCFEEDIPQTGDMTTVIVIVCICVALVGAGVLVFFGRKRLFK